MSQVLLQFAIQTVCLHQTVKFKNNFIGKTKSYIEASALEEAEGRIRLRLVA